MKNILVPIGSHENASNTLQYAIDFAKEVDAKIYLIYIFSNSRISGSFVNMNSVLIKESKKTLKELLSDVDKKDVDIISKSLGGHTVIDSVEQLTEAFQIDLIITSTKNSSIDKKVFLGNVTGSLVKDLDTPVLIIPSEAKFTSISKILLAIKSGRIKSVSTLTPLMSIQDKFSSTINLLQVRTPSLKENHFEINKGLNKIISNLIITENATVFQGVLEFLHDENPDLICVIRRKRGFFKKLWEGNRVKKVNFDSKKPLLVLKGAQ